MRRRAIACWGKQMKCTCILCFKSVTMSICAKPKKIFTISHFETQNEVSCKMMSSQKNALGPPPAASMAKFSKGKSIQIMAHERMLDSKTRRMPKRLTRCGKKVIEQVHSCTRKLRIPVRSTPGSGSVHHTRLASTTQGECTTRRWC